MTAFKSGTAVGPYEIISPLGAGGMGEVYRAKDPRLSREVAVKVLPTNLSSDPDRLRRFEQEARASGQLNHPNVLTVYDVGIHDAAPYVVSELLTGETLRERLGGSAIGLRKAIDYALQIAHGLAAAHEKAIVHRDLKPENIFVTRDGRVKILDFGLAKLAAPEPVPGQSNLLTVDPGTQPGIVLGTVGYMSPEQVRGRDVDHRSDIFTFGTILYEMITGKRAFHRESTVDTLSAILKEEPPEPSSIQHNIPAALERIIRHCLEKNPEERFHSAHDLAFDLEMISGTSGSGAQLTEPMKRRSSLRSKSLILGLLALLVLAAGGYFLTKALMGKNIQPSYQRLTFRRGYLSGAKFAPDNQTILYSASWSGAPRELFSTRVQSPASKSLNLPPADILSVSSTGELAILLNPRFTQGYQRTGTLAKVAIDGGAAREILENVQDADWTADGKDFAVVRNVLGKVRLEFPIGKIIYETNGWLSHICFSPDGKQIAAIEHPGRGDDRGSIALLDASGNKKDLTETWSSASGLAWSPDGKEIWFTASAEGSNQQMLRAVTIEGRDRIILSTAGNLILHDVASTGEILLTQDDRRREMIGFSKGDTAERDLSWFDWTFPRDISDDGKYVIFEEQGAGGGHNYSVYIRNMDGSAAIRLGEGYATSLSPDNQWILSHLPGVTNTLTILPAGPGQPKTIQLPKFERIDSPRWLPDGERIVLNATEKGQRARNYVYNLESGNIHQITPEIPPIPVVVTPDGKFVLTLCAEQGFCLYPVAGGQPQKVLGVETGDIVVTYTTSPDTVYAYKNHTFPVQVDTVNLVTGERKPWKQILPPDLAGTQLPIQMAITPDGSSYVYTYRRALSDLYMAKDVR